MTKRILCLLTAALFMLTAAGCGKIDVSRLLTRETVDRCPEISPLSTARAAASFRGPGAKLKISMQEGLVCIVEDSNLANQLLEAIADDTWLIRDESDCPFELPIEILDEMDTVLAKADAASDGCRYAMRPDGRVMMLPEYVYYTLEYDLWTCGASFSSRTVRYDSDRDSDGVLEMAFDTQLPTLFCRRCGYADGYFCQWKLYGIEENTNTVTASAMVRYSLYGLSEDSFEPVRQGCTAVRLTYDWVEDGVYRLGAVKFSDDSVAENQIQSTVRSVLSYEYTQQYMKDLKNTETLDSGILSLARDYLRQRGLGRLNLE